MASEGMYPNDYRGNREHNKHAIHEYFWNHNKLIENRNFFAKLKSFIGVFM
jgi:hypothetical protein